MKTPSPTQATQHHSAIGQLLHSAPLAQSAHADFKRGTWTFNVGPAARVAAGAYVLLPAEQASKALEQDRQASEAVAGATTFSPFTMLRARYFGVGGYQGFSLTSDCGSREITLYKRYPDADSARHGSRPDPARWSGHETRKDSTGREWTSCTPAYVVNDFGDLVEVPA